MKQQILRFDRNSTHWVVSTFGPSWRTFFECMTVLGDPVAIGVIALGIAITGVLRSDVRLLLSGMAIPLTVIIGALLKIAFERARPMTEYAMNMKLQTFSFPSGHSSGAMITYGLLAYLLFVKLPAPWNIVVACVFGIVPILVGVSRIYLGAHFPSDVVAGWILGLVALIFVIMVIRPVL